MSGVAMSRVIGIVAILAGILRGADAFAFEFVSRSDDQRTLFLLTDIFVLFAAIGIYGQVWRKAGWGGLAGFAAAVVGILIARTANDLIGIYIIGTALLAIGMSVMAVAMLAFRAFPPIAPSLWIAGLLAGVLAYFLQSDWVFEGASIVFGLGFVAAGVAIIRHPAA